MTELPRSNSQLPGSNSQLATRVIRWSLLFIGALFVFAQLLLPPQGWYSGDQGSKYLQARAFATQGPLNPGIDVLSRDVDPGYVHQEIKLKNRRGRLVSEFLWLMPLVTAPFLGAVGLRGLYVIPALSVMAMFIAAAALARRLADRDGATTAWIVLLVTPVAVYGLEFWEHAPAAAGVMAAAVLLVPRERSSHVALATAGACVAIGSLFREEAIVALPALVVARGLALSRHRMSGTIRAALWASLGAAVILAAAVPMNLVIYGTPLPMHMTGDALDVVKTTSYLGMRREVVVNLLLPARGALLYVVAVAAGLVASIAQMRRVDHGDDRSSRVLMTIVHASVLVTLAIGIGWPIVRKLEGFPQQYCFNAMSAAHTWPFWAAVLYSPWCFDSTHRPAVRFLNMAAVLLVAGILLIIPMDGGAQWSPRFLLAAAPLLGVVAAATALAAWRAASPSRSLRVAGAAIALAFAASVLMQASGVVLVRRAKLEMAKLTGSVASHVVPGAVVISDVFWVPEVTATLAPTRRMLFSRSPADTSAIVQSVASRGFREFAIITSAKLTGYEPPGRFDAAACGFHRGETIGLGFDLTLTRYRCARP